MRTIYCDIAVPDPTLTSTLSAEEKRDWRSTVAQRDMKRKLSTDSEDKKEGEGEVTSATDKGHRYGNFHSYYNFHPPVDRITLLTRKGGFLEYIKKNWNPSDTGNAEKNFHYVDVGCNEGDLTLEVAKAILDQLKGKLQTKVTVKGIDLDPVLIQRAQEKWQQNESADAAIQASFQEDDILSTEISETEAFTADFTSLFSTTMWIHIHGGDEGLTRVLKKLCAQTRHFLLIEPQPSKCYRNATMRLRKLGQPDVDVSSDRLKLRPKIEEEIDKILEEQSFKRVQPEETDTDKTKWNRSLRLYERISK
jgi:SAM-dependent methyltransferase